MHVSFYHGSVRIFPLYGAMNRTSRDQRLGGVRSVRLAAAYVRHYRRRRGGTGSTTKYVRYS